MKPVIRNPLAAEITLVKAGEVTAGKVADLVTPTATNESVDYLGLKKGPAATSVFKAGTVILLVAG